MIITGNCNTPDTENLLIIDIDVARDLFAAFALAGVMAGRDASEVNPRWAAAKAYDLADAMLEQRNEGLKK